jgi:hypothetical protein
LEGFSWLNTKYPRVEESFENMQVRMSTIDVWYQLQPQALAKDMELRFPGKLGMDGEVCACEK